MSNTKIVLIDFGTAVYNSQHNYHSIVSTRYYRPPELGWTFACDIWAVGCISVELFTGKLLFKTHDDIEHLALMEKILGPFPKEMIECVNRSASKNVEEKYVNNAKTIQVRVKSQEDNKGTYKPKDKI
ncbi:Protein kinase-like domain-containing protein [Rozella allomycis CSF55]|uniref:Protein kinase-like domain-containing protein n=1 Tax=Rozella allomycis (strain CSF55) TaxID=988480 RepID=A0A075AUV4_ROZAC|nr:Protein kinase-like domain-containing protein [Rozella allomycis CSF55]|eukprot:EPZ34061.1 Protein kinase-like domain-containing protein [Rozella allomycis CSF55]